MIRNEVYLHSVRYSSSLSNTKRHENFKQQSVTIVLHCTPFLVRTFESACLVCFSLTLLPALLRSGCRSRCNMDSLSRSRPIHMTTKGWALSLLLFRSPNFLLRFWHWKTGVFQYFVIVSFSLPFLSARREYIMVCILL